MVRTRIPFTGKRLEGVASGYWTLSVKQSSGLSATRVRVPLPPRVTRRLHLFLTSLFIALSLYWRTYGRLGEASRTQPRGSHQLGADGGGYGCVSALGAQLEAAGILLGADFDDCDPALHD